MTGGWEAGHVGADFGENGPRANFGDPGRCIDQLRGALIRVLGLLHRSDDLAVQALDGLSQGIHLREQFAQYDAVVIPDASLQGEL